MLKSALQDIKESTLAAVSGLLGKLAYLASLRLEQGAYQHWGMAVVHGQESTERALRAAHADIVTGVLRTPLSALAKDLQKSSQPSGLSPVVYVEKMRSQFDDLLPGERKDSPAASHLNSVLLALSKLEAAPERATRSTS